MTPSVPTFSKASASFSPIGLSLFAAIAATSVISFLPETFLDWPLTCSTTAATALSMPRFSAIGSAPAARALSPSLKIASARTVAVVVPSPAASEVLLAASLTSWAPMFSYGSVSSISSATVTPSLVTVGLPQPLSMTALRPRGPKVHRTARASLVTPLASFWRASSS